jgi:LysM repeat protein
VWQSEKGKKYSGRLTMFCQIRAIPHDPRMKPVFWIPALCALVISLTSCGTVGTGGGGISQQAGTGPFDQNGNYVDAWADNPSKWRKSGGSRSPHELKSDELPEIAQNEQPPQNSIPLDPAATSSKPARSISRTSVASRPKSAVKASPASAKTKVAPRPTVAKAKPKSTRYLVRQGDSLSVIASRTGCSISAIKSANGISGTLIRAGRTLTIPRK